MSDSGDLAHVMSQRNLCIYINIHLALVMSDSKLLHMSCPKEIYLYVYIHLVRVMCDSGDLTHVMSHRNLSMNVYKHTSCKCHV